MAKAKLVHGFLIKAKEREILPAIHDASDYKEISRMIGADLFTVVHLNDKGDMVFVDDEGLLNGQRYFFNIRGYPQPLAGNGLVLGTDQEGNTASTTITMKWLKENITFSEHKVLGFEVEEGTTDVLGKPGFFMRSTPIFGPPDTEEASDGPDKA